MNEEYGFVNSYSVRQVNREIIEGTWDREGRKGGNGEKGKMCWG